MDVEQRARELLADEFVRMGGLSGKYVEEVRKGIAGPWDRAAIGAIIAALTPPEGYVLVPSVLPEKMLDALYCAEGDMCDDDMQKLWQQLLSARPEVKP